MAAEVIAIAAALVAGDHATLMNGSQVVCVTVQATETGTAGLTYVWATADHNRQWTLRVQASELAKGCAK